MELDTQKELARKLLLHEKNRLDQTVVGRWLSTTLFFVVELVCYVVALTFVVGTLYLYVQTEETVVDSFLKFWELDRSDISYGDGKTLAAFFYRYILWLATPALGFAGLGFLHTMLRGKNRELRRLHASIETAGKYLSNPEIELAKEHQSL